MPPQHHAGLRLEAGARQRQLIQEAGDSGSQRTISGNQMQRSSRRPERHERIHSLVHIAHGERARRPFHVEQRRSDGGVMNAVWRLTATSARTTASGSLIAEVPGEVVLGQYRRQPATRSGRSRSLEGEAEQEDQNHDEREHLPRRVDAKCASIRSSGHRAHTRHVREPVAPR